MAFNAIHVWNHTLRMNSQGRRSAAYVPYRLHNSLYKRGMYLTVVVHHKLTTFTEVRQFRNLRSVSKTTWYTPLTETTTLHVPMHISYTHNTDGSVPAFLISTSQN